MANPSPENKLASRSPIVVVVGHVDHGKTSLIDYLRKSNIVAREAGGITQAVGAYEIEHPSTGSGQAKRITLIDTPGHEAFPKMRSRGANIADLAILVVAADDGVKPQTAEAIKVLQETQTPFIVAITKIDKNNADVENAKQDLTANGVLLEGFGGNVSFQPISSKTGEGIPELLDLLLLAAEVEELTYDPQAPASGFVLEAKKGKQRGLEVTLLVKNGILRQGEEIFTPHTKGKVKILENFMGKPAKELTPSSPAIVIGFEDLPLVGEEFSTNQTALSLKPKQELAVKDISKDKELVPIIIKASDAGSLEALHAIVDNLVYDRAFKILSSEIGDIHDNDVQTAISSKAIIAGFKNKVSPSAQRLADNNSAKIFTSAIIYQLIQELEKLIKDAAIEPNGVLEILAVFNQDKLPKQIVGGKITKGTVQDKARFDIMRNDQKIGDGKITNLQQNKQEAHSVSEGKEAGLMVVSDIAITSGDKLYFF
ncbi:MAG: GTP-binding protein [Anaplasmataceae bacterium]|nr:GTP-binding protein [Anaplasmataceae bacterium]